MVVCNWILPVEPILHFLTLHFLGSQHCTVSGTLLSNIISRAESLFGVLLAVRSALRDELSHILVHVDYAGIVIRSSRNAILSLGVSRTGPHVVIISQSTIILNSLLHIFLRVLILHVFRHRRISGRAA